MIADIDFTTVCIILGQTSSLLIALFLRIGFTDRPRMNHFRAWKLSRQFKLQQGVVR